MEIMKRILLSFFVFVTVCLDLGTPLQAYVIGRDPTWLPLKLNTQTVNLNGFTNALMENMGRVEGDEFQLIDVAWNQIVNGLKSEDYDAILTSLDPTVITEGKYSFSDPFLMLGPVLVVPIDSKASSLTDLENAVVGAYQYDDSVLIIQKHPSIIIELYPNLIDALEDVANGKIMGMMLPTLDANLLVPTQYAKRLKIVTQPLTDAGLRMVVLKGEQEALIEEFNDGLKKLCSEGTYTILRKKFGLL